MGLRNKIIYIYCCNHTPHNNIDTLLQSILSMYFTDDDGCFLVHPLTLLQSQFVTSFITNTSFYYGTLHKINDLYDDLANSDYVCCAEFSEHFDLLLYLLDNGWFVNRDKTYVYHP